MPKSIILDFEDAYIERALRLPQGWFSCINLSPTDLATKTALIRIIQTFPWVVQLADEDFDPAFADHAVIREALKHLSKEKP